MSEKQDVYKYLGTVASLDYASNIIRLWDYCGPCEQRKQPILLYASVGLLNYLNALYDTDEEERYTKANYFYGDMLMVTRIEVPGDGYYPAKIVACEEVWSKEVVIFGEQEYINTDQPKSMSNEEYNRWLKWKGEYIK